MEFRNYRLGKYDIIMRNEHPGSGMVNAHNDEFKRFEHIIDNIKKEQPIMIELGCFWALWSIIFRKKFPNGKTIILEGDENKLDVGISNLNKNNIDILKYYHNTISRDFSDSSFNPNVNDISLDNIIIENNITHIDLLHADIQGSEIRLIDDILILLSNRKITNIIIATHSTEIHNTILDKLGSLNLELTINDIEYSHKKHDGEIIIKLN